MTRAVETVVVGAGISGLAYAHARGAAADLALLEASERAGGLVRTIRSDAAGGARAEAGPEALASGSAETSELLRELSLETCELGVEAKKRYLVHRGRLQALPSDPMEFLKSPLLSGSAKARAMTEKWRARETALDGSIADFVRHRLGREVLEGFVDPLVSGIHAGDPEQLSLRACFPEVVHLVEEHGSLLAAMSARRGGEKSAASLLKPAGGMEALPRALASAIGVRLRLSCTVRSIERRGERWILDTEGDVYEARRVVLAAPARQAEQLLARVSPAAAQELATLRCESLVSLSYLYARERVAHPLDGFGYLAPSREGLLHLGTLFSSSIDPSSCADGHVLLRTLLGGARHPELVELEDDELRHLIELEVAPLLGLSGPPEWIHVARYREALPRYDLDHPRRVNAIEAALAQLPDIAMLGNSLRGIALGALITSARALAREHAAASS